MTGDRLGGIRLWPALDGTREPVVVPGPAPQAVAVVTASDGFVIGLLDSAGGVQLVHTSASGEVRERTALEAQITALEAVGDGFLVLRADQRLAYVDPHGRMRSTLEPEPGTHITSLLVRNGKVVALVQDGKRMLARHVLIDDADHTAAWGDTSPPMAIAIKSAVLSPSGTLLAVQRPRNLHPVLVELATGKVKTKALCVERQWPSDDDGIDVQEVFRNEQSPAPLGFVTDEVVACSVMDRLVWWSTGGESLSGTSLATSAIPVVATDTGIVTSTGTNLAFVDLAGMHFLGYGVQTISRIHFGPTGTMIDRNDQQQLVLDRDLREHARIELGHNWLDAEAIDDRYALALVRRDGSKVSPSGNQLAVYDLVAKAYRQMVPELVTDTLLDYEPTTHLVSLMASDNAPALLVRLDPATHRFAPAMPVETGWSSAWPVDPTQTGGIVAYAVAANSVGTLMIGEIRETDLRASGPVRPSSVWRASGQLRTIDRHGRVYVRAGDDLVIYARGQIAGTSRGTGAYNITINRAATRIAAIEQQQIRLLEPTGATLWETKQWATGSIGWDGDDLVVQFTGGLAKLDAATGAVTERRCGWAFGLTDQLSDGGQNQASICDATH